MLSSFKERKHEMPLLQSDLKLNMFFSSSIMLSHQCISHNFMSLCGWLVVNVTHSKTHCRILLLNFYQDFDDAWFCLPNLKIAHLWTMLFIWWPKDFTTFYCQPLSATAQCNGVCHNNLPLELDSNEERDNSRYGIVTLALMFRALLAHMWCRHMSCCREVILKQWGEYFLICFTPTSGSCCDYSMHDYTQTDMAGSVSE